MSELSGTRVAILVQNLPVPFDRRVWQESKALTAAGADVTVVCPGDERHPVGRFVIDGVVVRRYEAPHEARGVAGYLNEYSTSLRRMSQALRSERENGAFDVIHFCNPPDLLYRVARRYKRRDRSVIVFDQHDLGPELVRAKRMPLTALLVAVARFFESRTYRLADHVIATNESYKAIARRRGGFNADDVTVVRSGPPRDWADFAPDERDWRDGHEYLIGYVGVMGKQEGIQYLIDAVDHLWHDHGLDVHLALVGGGPEYAALNALAADRGLTDRVTFHGRVPDDALKSILASSDVCVNPDEVNEMNNLSTMNKIVEYMALGRPIVQFDVTEGRFSAGSSSLYADANDAASFANRIRELLLDSGLRDRMGEDGRARFVNELCWETQAPRLVGAYSRLVSRS